LLENRLRLLRLPTGPSIECRQDPRRCQSRPPTSADPLEQTGRQAESSKDGWMRLKKSIVNPGTR
jgi:hypothetical protein